MHLYKVQNLAGSSFMEELLHQCGVTQKRSVRASAVAKENQVSLMALLVLGSSFGH